MHVAWVLNINYVHRHLKVTGYRRVSMAYAKTLAAFH